MATRANILVYKDGKLKAILYKHHDGYPEYQGCFVKQFLSKCIEGTCGCEPYFVINGLLHGEAKDDEGEPLIYNWSDGVAGDINYLYIIHCNTHKEAFGDDLVDRYSRPTIQCYQRCGAVINKLIVTDLTDGWKEVAIPSTTKESILDRLSKAVSGTDKELYTEEELYKFAAFYVDKWDANTSEDVIAESFTDFWWDSKKPCRRCSECGKLFRDGYCVDGGLDYYCSDECLHIHFSPEEWEEECNSNDQSYYSEWY